MSLCAICFVFFFNDTATTEIYTLSLHDALPISSMLSPTYGIYSGYELYENKPVTQGSEEYLHSEKYELRHRDLNVERSEEHTSELQSRQYLVCRLLLEKKKQKHNVL